MVQERPRLVQMTTILGLELVSTIPAVPLEETLGLKEPAGSVRQVLLDKPQEHAVENSNVGLNRVVSLDSDSKNSNIDLDKVVSLDSNNESSNIDLDKVISLDSNNESSNIDLDKVVSLDSNNESSNIDLDKVVSLDSNNESSNIDLDKFVSLDSNNESSNIDLDKVVSLDSNNENSNIDLDKVVSLDSNNESSNIGFSRCVSVGKNSSFGLDTLVSFDSSNKNSSSDSDSIFSEVSNNKNSSVGFDRVLSADSSNKNSKAYLDRLSVDSNIKNNSVGFDKVLSVDGKNKNNSVRFDNVLSVDSENKNRTAALDRVASFDINAPVDNHVLHESLQLDSPMGADICPFDLSQELPGKLLTNQTQTMSAEALTNSDFGLAHHDFSTSDDIETDCAASPNILGTRSPCNLLDSNNSLDVLSSSFSSSDDEEGLCDENLSRDPRYVKQFEQALKLGYSEGNVIKVLKELGPECKGNDLLSRLIDLEVAGPDVVLSDRPQQEADLEEYDVADYTKMSSSCSTTLTSSAGISENSVISSGLEINDDNRNNLHYIIIDGSNVAMSHGKNVFSCRGIQIAVEWFQARGHDNITVFIPQWRKEASRPDALITDQDILYDLEKQGIVVFTPARRVKGRRVVCYDDRFILKLAVETDGVVVSNDVYRDLVREREEFRHVVDQRLLMYSFVNDRFMPPEDPLGRKGPTLDDFLCKAPLQPQPKPQNCPYGKKCTYGNKCRFYHPERGFAPQKSITETLKEQAETKLQERASKMLEVAEKGKRQKQKLSRTNSMIPIESLPTPFTPAGTNEAKRKQEKPKFGQSKSMIFPEKSSDYLNEPRKKLEEAERAAVLDQMVMDELYFVEKSSLNIFDSAYDDKLLKTPSPGVSPGHQTETLIQNTLAEENHLGLTSPINVSNTNSSETSPALQNLALPENSEKYVRGHLLLAKKLSYENKESSFFSEHGSNASSAQISSPNISVGKSNGPVQFSQKDSEHGQNMNFGMSVGSPQLYSFYMQQNPQDAYVTMSGLYPGLTRSVSASANTAETPGFRQQTDSGISSLPYRHEILDRMKFNDFMDPRSPDSGIYTPTESIPKAFPSHPEGQFEMYKSYPQSNSVESAISPRFMSLQRAYSSTENVRNAEEFQRKLARRMSSSTASPLSGNLMAPNQYQQHNVPPPLTPAQYKFGQFPGLARQTSISDPEIHSSSAMGNLQGNFQDVFSSLHLNTNFHNYYTPQNQQFPKQFQYVQQQNLQQSYQQTQRNNHDLFKTQQPPLNSSQFPQFISNPSMTNWGQPSHSTNLDPFSSMETAPPPGQYNPHQNTIFFPNTSHTPHITPSTPTQSMPGTAGSHMYNPSHKQNTILYPQSPTLFRSSPPGSFSTGPTFHSQPTSHQQNAIPQNNSQSIQPVLKCQVLKEDSDILPNDARYTIYYHLSNVFGEQIVRKVMNLNPDILDPTQICQLLMKYKETGR